MIGQFLLFLCLLGGVIGSVCPTTDASDVFHVYVDPLGDDARSGLTASEAVKTLQKASYIVTERLSSCHKNTVVHLGAGVFHDDYDRDTRWGFSMPGHYITIRGAGMWTGGTVFDGSTATRSTPYWLRIARDNIDRRDKQNIIIENIRVQNFHHGLHVSGKRCSGTQDPYVRSSGNIRVRRVYFHRIGAGYVRETTESHSAIYFTNSDYNVVEKCYFDQISNNANFDGNYVDYGGLHAIYTNRAQHIYILKNTFKRVYARGVVKFRDFSNFGRVEGNKFLDDTSLFQDKYCDQSRSDCVSAGKNFNECPSYGISFKNNVVHHIRRSYRVTIDIDPDFPRNMEYCTSSAIWADRGLDKPAVNPRFQFPRIFLDNSNKNPSNTLLPRDQILAPGFDNAHLWAIASPSMASDADGSIVAVRSSSSSAAVKSSSTTSSSSSSNDMLYVAVAVLGSLLVLVSMVLVVVLYRSAAARSQTTDYSYRSME